MNKELWDKVKAPPKTALKEIRGGRLKGFTDINPQWRLQAMTEQFGVIGFGWFFDIQRLWLEKASSGEVGAFAQVNIFIKQGDEWSKPITGIGGSKFEAIEKGSLVASDECYKMAVTDALGTAMKALGVGAEIYLGNYDGSKYRYTEEEAPRQQEPPRQPPRKNKGTPEERKANGIDQVNSLIALIPNPAEQVEYEAQLNSILEDGTTDEQVKRLGEMYKYLSEVTSGQA